MNRFSLTPAARRDLKSIWLFIATDTVRHADLVESAIWATCRIAANDPKLGHARADVGNPNIMFLTVIEYRKYQIAYAYPNRSLRVLRILQGARDIPTLFQ